MYAAWIGEVDGIRLLTAETIDRATRSADRAAPTGAHGCETTLRPRLHDARRPSRRFGGPEWFGHPGAGGSVGFADPERGVAFGYVMNQMQKNLAGDPRPAGLIDAVKASL